MSRPSKRGLRVEALEERVLFASLSGHSSLVSHIGEGEEVSSGRVSGYVFADLDRNGEQDADEPPLEGESVFLDLNQNRVRDLQSSGTPEPVVLTDANGFFEFNSLGSGSHVIALENVLPDEITVPSLVTLGSAIQTETGAASAVAVADINDDGTADLIATHAGDNMVVLDLRDGQPRVLSPEIAPSLGNEPIDLVAKDFDGDGLVDVAVATRTQGKVNVLLSQAPEIVNHPGCNAISEATVSFLYPTICEVASAGLLTSINAADFDRDGDLDLVVSAEQDANNGRLEIFENKGRGRFVAAGSRLVGPRPRSLLVGEFRTDFGPEVAILHRGTDTEPGSVSIIAIDGTEPAETDTPVGTAGLGARDLVNADLNFDGHQDFVVANSSANEVTVFWYNPQTKLYEGFAVPLTTVATSIAVADFDLDQDVDLIVTSGANGDQVAFIANQSTTPAQRPEFAEALIVGQAPTPATPSVDIVAADINNDSLSDVVIALGATDHGGVATLANLYTAHRVELTQQAPEHEIVFGVLRNAHLNRQSPADVDDNSEITARDALLIINQIGKVDADGTLPLINTSGRFLDVNGDRRVTAGDALIVINEIARQRLRASSDAEMISLARVDERMREMRSIPRVSITWRTRNHDSIGLRSKRPFFG